ncbi:UNVERIFIED_CONTAM: hypothetical protein RMT77_013335 [Armadillidium vulgare]
MMNADKQVLYSGVPQEDWQNKSKYPRIMSNGPKPPKTPEKSRKTSSVIPFLILTGITLLISAGVVIGLHYIKYTEKDGLIFITGGTNKTSGNTPLPGPETLKPNPIPDGNGNPTGSVNPIVHQNPNDKESDQGKEASQKVEPTEKDKNIQANPQIPDDSKASNPTTDDGNKDQESISNSNIKSDKENGEIALENGQHAPENGQHTPENGQHTPENGQQTPENGQHTPENGNVNEDNKNTVDDTTAGEEKQNPAYLPADNQENANADDDGWSDIIKTDGDLIIFQKLTTSNPQETKETDNENLPTKKEEKKAEKETEEKVEKEEKKEEEKDDKILDKKDKLIDPSKGKEEKEEDNKEEEKAKKEDKENKENEPLLYQAVNNFAQKYFNSTNLNPSQVASLIKNLSVGPSLEVIIIASGIIFIGLSLLIIAITCLVTRTRKVKIRREKIKKAVSDLEGAEKVILLTDEQSEDEYVKA